MTENTPSASVDTLQKFAMPLAIVVAGALIAGAVFMNGQKQPVVAGGPQQASVNIKDVKIGPDDPYIGKKDAPVVMAYWSDYQCPFCKAVEVGGIPQIPIEPALPILIKDYVDAGKLKIVFKDFSFLGQDSDTAALYEHAIWQTYPDKFYAWREAMFKAQDDEGDNGFGDEASILALIRTITGLDADKLKNVVAQNKEKYLGLIQADETEAASFGISGTPGFIVGTTLIAGADQPAVFKAAIDAQLK